MFNKYPYTDFHELNLDWIIAQIKQLHHDYDEFKAVNTITNAGAWDITKQYQAWTIVSDNNNGYISLQPVPAGVAISNTDYWGHVADYNILITNLTARVSALENQVSTINGQITAIKRDIEPIINRKFVFIGDSYNYYGGGWLSGVISALGITTYYDYTASGHGFTTSPENWGDDIQQFVSDHSDVAADITDIVIVGGINDSVPAQLPDLETNLSSFISYCAANLPKGHITMCFVGNANASSTVLYGRTYENRLQVIATEQRLLNTAGHTFAEGCQNALFQYTLFESDGLHPNTPGQRYGIIPAVVAALLKEEFVPAYTYRFNTDVLAANGIYERINHGINTLDIFMYQIPDTTAISNADWTTIAALPARVSGTHHEPVLAIVDKRDVPSSTRYTVWVRVEAGEVQVRSALTANSGVFDNFTANAKTYIVGAHFVDDIQNSI